MDLMKEALKRRMNQGLDIKISVVPSGETTEEEKRTSDLAPNPENEDDGDAEKGQHMMPNGKMMEDDEMEFSDDEAKGPSLFARALRGMKKGKK